MKTAFAACKLICVLIIGIYNPQCSTEATSTLHENQNAFFCKRSRNEKQKDVGRSRQREAFLVTIVNENDDVGMTRRCSLLWLPLKATNFSVPKLQPFLQRLENVTESISEFGVFAMRGQFYFHYDDQILRQDFEGGINSRVLIAKDIELCFDMKIDQTTGAVYCVCEQDDDDSFTNNKNRITVFMLPGGIAKNVRKKDHIVYANNSSRNIRTLALDSNDKILFWLSTESAEAAGQGWFEEIHLERMREDGSGRRTLLKLNGSHWIQPFGLTIDTIGKRLFWADNGRNIWHVNYDGSGKGMVSTPTDISPLLYYDCQLYWIDSSARVNRYDLLNNSTSKREKVACMVEDDSPETSSIAVIS